MQNVAVVAAAVWDPHFCAAECRACSIYLSVAALVYSGFLSCSHFVAEANRRLLATDFHDKLME